MTSNSKDTSPRIRLRRAPKRARYDQESIYQVLDRGRVAHLAFVDGGQPFCIPTLYARVGDHVLIHGSAASRMLGLLGGGAPACLTVTLLDGLVLARSAFEHSANYDSVVLLGRFQEVDDGHKRHALQAFMEVQLPGRWPEVRQPNPKELKGTTILSLAIAEASVKTRTGPPDDDGSSDAALDVWAGVVPLAHGCGQPQPSPGLRPGIEPSAAVRRLMARATCPPVGIENPTSFEATPRQETP